MNTLLVRLISRLLLMPSFVVAVAVLVKGYAQPGDGFSAGVIAAMGLLLQYIAFGFEMIEAHLPVRHAAWLATGGLALALATVFVPPLFGYPALTHFPRPGEPVIHAGLLAVHTAVLFDIGVFALVLGFSISVLRWIARAGREAEA